MNANISWRDILSWVDHWTGVVQFESNTIAFLSTAPGVYGITLWTGATVRVNKSSALK
jgi:hypothetical protein